MPPLNQRAYSTKNSTRTRPPRVLNALQLLERYLFVMLCMIVLYSFRSGIDTENDCCPQATFSPIG